MPGISAISCITWETERLPLSVILSAGKKAYLDMMLIITFTKFSAVGLDTD